MSGRPATPHTPGAWGRGDPSGVWVVYLIDANHLRHTLATVHAVEPDPGEHDAAAFDAEANARLFVQAPGLLAAAVALLARLDALPTVGPALWLDAQLAALRAAVAAARGEE